MRRAAARNGGFTLVEMIVAMVLLGIVAGLGVQFVKPAVEAFNSSVKRQGLGDNANLIARRLERELHAALPNSIRVMAITNGYALEFIPVSGGGLYRAFPTSGGSGGVLRFDTTSTGFDVIGPVPVYASGTQLVIANLGSGSGADAYAGSNRAAITSSNSSVSAFSTDAAPHTVSFASKQFPVPSPSYRFQVVGTPVSYVCNTAAKTLVRYSGYGWNSAQVAPPAGGSAATVTTLLDGNASGCTIRYAAGTANSRAGLASIELRLTNALGESIDMIAQVNVTNEP